MFDIISREILGFFKSLFDKVLDLMGQHSLYVLLLLLLLLKKIGNAKQGEGDWEPISPKTPAPHYQPIEEKKRKVK